MLTINQSVTSNGECAQLHELEPMLKEALGRDILGLRTFLARCFSGISGGKLGAKRTKAFKVRNAYSEYQALATKLSRLQRAAESYAELCSLAGAPLGARMIGEDTRHKNEPLKWDESVNLAIRQAYRIALPSSQVDLPDTNDNSVLLRFIVESYAQIQNAQLVAPKGGDVVGQVSMSRQDQTFAVALPVAFKRALSEITDRMNSLKQYDILPFIDNQRERQCEALGKRTHATAPIVGGAESEAHTNLQ